MKKTKPRFPNLLDRLYPPEQRRRSAAMAVLLGALATVYFLLPPPALESLRDERGYCACQLLANRRAAGSTLSSAPGEKRN
jgi:hypothetical protein